MRGESGNPAAVVRPPAVHLHAFDVYPFAARASVHGWQTGAAMSAERRAIAAGVLIGGILVATVFVTFAVRSWRHEREVAERAAALTGGDPEAGREALRRLGCTTCHSVPGVPGANGLVGPPLAHLASRAYIAGVLPNTAANLIVWIRWPQGVLPKNAMPNLGASEADGRNIAAYLYTLE
jgi:cytochrome c